MFLFKLKSGKCILHTGDFRATHEMEEYPELWNNDIDVIYLDTTYLSSKYDFCTQSDSIQTILFECQRFLEAKSGGSAKVLIICGSYKIGKEKIWLKIAQEFGFKVWIDAERRRAIQCIADPSISEVLVDCPTDANIHVIPLGNLGYKVIQFYWSLV